jgi:hypothetical protein
MPSTPPRSPAQFTLFQAKELVHRNIEPAELPGRSGWADQFACPKCEGHHTRLTTALSPTGSVHVVCLNPDCGYTYAVRGE